MPATILRAGAAGGVLGTQIRPFLRQIPVADARKALAFQVVHLPVRTVAAFHVLVVAQAAHGMSVAQADPIVLTRRWRYQQAFA